MINQIVRGNSFVVVANIDARDANGNCTPLLPGRTEAVLVGRYHRILCQCEASEGVVRVHVGSDTGLGTYGVEISGLSLTGQPYRVYGRDVFRIVESQRDVCGCASGVADPGAEMTIELALVASIGPKGDPFVYEDFTEEQLADLRRPAEEAFRKSEIAWTRVNERMKEVDSGMETMSDLLNQSNAVLSLANGTIEYVRSESETLKEISSHAVEHANEAADLALESSAKADEAAAAANEAADRALASAVGLGTEGGGEVFNDYERNVASGEYSHAEGSNTKAEGIRSHAEGDSTTASGKYAHAEGDKTNASGTYSHAEGSNTKAGGYASHAEGDSTTASVGGSHAEGFGTTASGYRSHAEGESTKASGYASHAEGQNTIASSGYSHAEGYGTKAYGEYSHAEGQNTNALGYASHAEGYHTTTTNRAEHACGLYNRSMGSTSDADATLWSVGNGTGDSDRKNAAELKRNGDFFVANRLIAYAGKEGQTDVVSYIKNLASRVSALETENASLKIRVEDLENALENTVTMDIDYDDGTGERIVFVTKPTEDA